MSNNFDYGKSVQDKQDKCMDQLKHKFNRIAELEAERLDLGREIDEHLCAIDLYRAEVERLKDALEDIAEYSQPCCADQEVPYRIAKQALGEQE